MADATGRKLRKILKLKYPAMHYITVDSRLSSLGDAVVNYIASVSETMRRGLPTGTRVDNKTLMKAVRESGLRETLTHRRDKHMLGDAAEALIAYAWIKGTATLEEYVDTILTSESLQDGMTQVLRLAMRRAGVAKGDSRQN